MDEKSGKPAENVTPLRKPVPCPICKTPSSRTHYPFCSRRCADIDLNRWFSGSYAVPGDPQDGSREEE
jgi:endogenous inhibitor of DNA gyrase (YacG/DUF329 family)